MLVLAALPLGAATPAAAQGDCDRTIEEAKIRTIYTAMFYPPPELAVPNWPPYAGNWPLPAGVVPSPATPRQ